MDAVKCSSKDKTKSILIVACTLGVLLAVPDLVRAQNGKRRFTVADDIALTQLNRTASSNSGNRVNLSPDSHYFWVLADRGRIDLNKAESSIRVYRVSDIVAFLSHPERTEEPAPFWSITEASFKYGPILDHVRWLKDSSGLAFLCRTSTGINRLFVAQLRTKKITPLTPENLYVTGFDVQSKKTFVYTVLSPAIRTKDAEDGRRPAIIGTNRSLRELLHTKDTIPQYDLSELWAVVGGKRFRLVNRNTTDPLPIHLEGQGALAMSPSGRAVVTALTVADVPPEWETMFPSRSPSYPTRVRAGRQDPNTFIGNNDVSEFVLVDLLTKEIKRLTQAPTGNGAGWFGSANADWSADGKFVVLSNTFLAPKSPNLSPERGEPCVAVVEIATDTPVCLEVPERRHTNAATSRQRILDAQFVLGKKYSVQVTYRTSGRELPWSATFDRQSDGSWTAGTIEAEAPRDNIELDIFIKEGLNSPPVVMATDDRTSVSRVIWDPNPQLSGIKLGETSVYRWKDKVGRSWVGGLYKPPDYSRGTRYPLIIQAGSFSEHEFWPSGSYPTAFAAQELAAVGFVVLQVENCSLRSTTEEAPCQVAGYESAVEQLASEGLVNPEQLGIVGFSRNCYYVLEALTTSTLKFKAASITDGVTYSYLQYITTLGQDGRDFAAHGAEAAIGAPPFGSGLSRWFARSPGFNLEKVATPLMVVAANRPLDIVDMWDVYAALRHFHKPVEFIVRNTDEHVFTNPAQRLLSQGTTVDWFQFWLHDYRDLDSSKADQYMRWLELRRLQSDK